MQVFENREYMIIHLAEIDKVDFSQILEESIEQIRKSVDNLKCIVKWEGDIIPSSIEALNYKDGSYTHSEIMDILNTTEWVNNTPI